MDKNDFIKQYQTKEWYDLSKRIKARDHNTCQMCGCNDKPVSVHHMHYGEDGSIFDVDDSSLITLCDDCHREQKDYKEIVVCLLDCLRYDFTDFEIFVIINYVVGKIQRSGTILDKTTRPLEEVIPLLSCSFSPNDIQKMCRLSKWREDVRKHIYMKEAIIRFYENRNNSKYVEKLGKWWEKDFNCNLKDFIDNEG